MSLPCLCTVGKQTQRLAGPGPRPHREATASLGPGQGAASVPTVGARRTSQVLGHVSLVPSCSKCWLAWAWRPGGTKTLLSTASPRAAPSCPPPLQDTDRTPPPPHYCLQAFAQVSLASVSPSRATGSCGIRGLFRVRPDVVVEGPGIVTIQRRNWGIRGRITNQPTW